MKKLLIVGGAVAGAAFVLRQLPCPELAFAGFARFWQVREQYDTPAYRRHCATLAAPVAAMLERGRHQFPWIGAAAPARARTRRCRPRAPRTDPGSRRRRC